MVQTIQPFRGGSIEIYNLKLKQRAEDEDRIFLGNAFYREQIRRGQAILRYDHPTLGPRCLWARRGGYKFFDMNQKIIQANIEGNLHSLQGLDILKQEVVLGRALEALERGEAVDIVALEKANGEQLQLSFMAEL